jgi:PhnB protein
MRIDAYLFFPGNTREAMEFYQAAFGGELTVTTKGEVDPSAEGAETDQVMNAALLREDIRIRASDRADATHAPQHRVALSIVGPEEAELRALFDQLSAGGSTVVALEKQFWGDTFGMLTDRFGISWQVNIEAKT